MEWLETIIADMQFSVELFIAELLFCRSLVRRKGFPWKLPLVCGMIIAYSLILNQNVLPPSGFIIRSLTFVFIITVMAMAVCYIGTLRDFFLFAVCGYMVQHCAYSFHELLKLGPEWISGGISDSPLIELVSLIVVYGICYLILDKAFIQTIAKNAGMSLSPVIVVLDSGFLLVAVSINFICYGLPARQNMVCRLLVAFICVLGLADTAEKLNSRRLEQDLSAIRQQTEAKADYYELLRDSIEATNIRCHDIKHQLSGLRLQAQGVNGTVSLPQESIEELENSINIYDAIAKTGNAALDTVLTEKSLVCQKEKIRFVYMADGGGLKMIKDRDVYALFGNILDNAIEAVRKLPLPEQRIIHFSAVMNGPFLKIHLYNYFTGELTIEGGLPVTTKQDKLFHGFGMKSVRMIVDKYQGTMQIAAQDQIFSLDITLPVIST